MISMPIAMAVRVCAPESLSRIVATT